MSAKGTTLGNGVPLRTNQIAAFHLRGRHSKGEILGALNHPLPTGILFSILLGGSILSKTKLGILQFSSGNFFIAYFVG